jgi:hypothetical protein
MIYLLTGLLIGLGPPPGRQFVILNVEDNTAYFWSRAIKETYYKRISILSIDPCKDSTLTVYCYNKEQLDTFNQLNLLDSSVFKSLKVGALVEIKFFDRKCSYIEEIRILKRGELNLKTTRKNFNDRIQEEFLMKQLGSGIYAERKRATQSLIDLGWDVHDSLFTGLDSSDPEIHQLSLHCLEKILEKRNGVKDPSHIIEF